MAPNLLLRRAMIPLRTLFAVPLLMACGSEPKQAPRSAAAPTAPVTTETGPDPSERDDQLAKAVEGLEGLPLRQLQAGRTCNDQSITVCQATCDGGDLEACTEVGSMLMEGRRVPRDPLKAGAVLEAACAKGGMRACYLNGVQFMVTDGPRAAKSFESVCASDAVPWNTVSCPMLVTMIDRGWYKPSLPKKIELYRRLCAWSQASPSPSDTIGACGRLKDLAESH